MSCTDPLVAERFRNRRLAEEERRQKAKETITDLTSEDLIEELLKRKDGLVLIKKAVVAND